MNTMNGNSENIKKAISFLRCPRCSHGFRMENEKAVCENCLFSAVVRQGIIFCFEETVITGTASERTMYGPELQELEKDLADNKSEKVSFLKYLKIQDRNAVCLDFGCGSSRQVFDLADQFQDGIIFGTDFDIMPLDIVANLAKKLEYKNIFLIQYRSADLPFRNNIFNVVTAHQVLEHIPHPERSVSEIHRTMKREGVFEVDFPNGQSIGEIGRRIFHWIAKTKNPHISRIGLTRAKNFFQRAGFQTENFRSVLALTGPLSYFFEGFVLRFILKRQKIWEIRKSYQNSRFFRILARGERNIGKLFPRAGHAFEFILTKT